MSTFTFTWPSGPNEVIVTGTFDNWSQSLPLVKQSSGDFEITVPLKTDDKILFKFIVDGDWVINQSFKIEKDESGNENNVVYTDDLVTESSTSGSKIPEAGGLAAVAGVGAAATTAAAATSSSKEEEKEFKPTVLPSSEGQQQTLGEPGIVIPQNANEIKEFSEISTVDPKTLNEESSTPVEEPTTVSETKEEEVLPTTSEEEKTKKVKKVVKKVKKEEETPVPSTTASKSPSANGTPKKEKKKGFFSKIKKALA